MKSGREACEKIIFPQSVARIYIAHGKCLSQFSGSSLIQSNSKATILMEIHFLLENEF